MGEVAAWVSGTAATECSPVVGDIIIIFLMPDKEVITGRRMRQLVLELSDEGLHVVVFSHGDGALDPGNISYKWISMPDGREGLLKRLEDAVYDNPLLLGDFSRTTVFCGSRRFMVLPDIIESGSDGAVSAFRRLFPAGMPDGEGEIMFSHIGCMELSVAFEIPAAVAAFLRRTFPGVRLEHPVVPLCRYFRGKYGQRCYGKTLANICGKRLDIITLGNRAPLMVNSFSFREPMDAVYYILAARKSLGLADIDEIIIGGDRLTRAQVTPVLRRYVRYVMPAIFPEAMLRAGREALAAPFEMVLTVMG